MKFHYFATRFVYHLLNFQDRKRLSKEHTQNNIIVKKDIYYNSDQNKDHQLDFFAPKDKWNGMCIFDIHGGIYFYGSKNNNAYYNAEFASTGYKVIGLSYSLMNYKDMSIKNQIDDIIAAILYCYQHNDIYQIDFQNIIIRGDSSGGHLALLINLILNNKELAALFSYQIPQDIKCIAVALSSPVFDYETIYDMAEPILSKKAKASIFSNRIDENGFIDLYNPRRYLDLKYAVSPCFVVSCHNDFLKYQSFKLVDKLIKNNYDHEFVFKLSDDKNIGHIFNILQLNNELAKDANRKMSDYFIAHYKKK